MERSLMPASRNQKACKFIQSKSTELRTDSIAYEVIYMFSII